MIRLRRRTPWYAGHMRLDGIRGVTFDAGGTLIAANPGVGEIYAEVAASHGIATDPGILETRFRSTFKRLRPMEGGQVSEGTERVFWKGLARDVFADAMSDPVFEELYPGLWKTFSEARRWRLLPGAVETLEELSRRGLKVAVVSNFDARLHSVLAGLGIARLFDGVFISAEVGVAKPEAGIFEYAARELGLEARELVHVGDCVAADAEGATSAGWSAVLVGNSHPRAIRIAALDEVPGLLGC